MLNAFNGCQSLLPSFFVKKKSINLFESYFFYLTVEISSYTSNGSNSKFGRY